MSTTDREYGAQDAQGNEPTEEQTGPTGKSLADLPDFTTPNPHQEESEPELESRDGTNSTETNGDADTPLSTTTTEETVTTESTQTTEAPAEVPAAAPESESEGGRLSNLIPKRQK